MRDRLIELIQEAYDGCVKRSSASIADHLIANGVIVPPCRVGDKVYRITKMYSGKTEIFDGIVFEFAITHEHRGEKRRFYFCANGEDFVSRCRSLWCDFDEFGKTVFLTREEAEKALKEREGK